MFSKIKFNLYWSKFFNKQEDYASKLNFNNLIELKNILSDINNFITNIIINISAKIISNILNYSSDIEDQLLKQIEKTNVNSNGYDIEFQNFICEVKVNIPVNKSSKFGAKQKEGILKDLNFLLYPDLKTKSKKSNQDIIFKFMTFYCDSKNTLIAIEDVINKANNNFGNYFFIYNKTLKIIPNNIYILLITPEEIKKYNI